MRLIEPLALLHAEAAADAMAAGLALPLAGGPIAFTLARLIDPGASPCLLPVSAIPNTWRAELARVTRAPPPWAGLTGTLAIMGILNVTPDSFSDGGTHLAAAVAIAAGHAMAEAGAAILDVGGETTKPGAPPVSPAVEQERILPVIRALAGAGHVVSVDTRNATTMAAALDAGARIVNDVSALTHDLAAAGLLARRRCPVVLMHMRGTPATMQSLAVYRDPAVEITTELAARIAAAESAGIVRADIAIDPGIGFAKTVAHNRDILRRIALLANLGCRVVLGVSRKSMIGRIAQQPDPLRRGPGSLAAALFGLIGGAAILRVHDVVETIQAVRIWQALQAGVSPALTDPADTAPARG